MDQQIAAQPVPAGWYPDPYAAAPGAERWWDGVAWSQEFARNAQQASQVNDQMQAAQSPPAGGATSPKATLAMVIGALLILWRLYFMSRPDTWIEPSAGYRTGAVVGAAVGMFLSAWLFSWGLTRRDAADQFGNEKMFPIAIGITVVGLAIGFMI